MTLVSWTIFNLSEINSIAFWQTKLEWENMDIIKISIDIMELQQNYATNMVWKIA